MNTEVKLHPSTELLNQFVQGDLVTGKSVVISAHMELCNACSAKAKELQSFAVPLGLTMAMACKLINLSKLTIQLWWQAS